MKCSNKNSACKALINRKYYKYQYTAWTQPILTSNSTSTADGIITTSASQQYSSSYAAWHAMDGSTEGTAGWATNSTSGNWTVVFPYTLEISKITIWGRGISGEAKIYNGVGGTLLGTITGDTETDVTVNVQTNTIYITVTGEQTVGITEILFTARKVEIVPGTAEDYDFYDDGEILVSSEQPLMPEKFWQNDYLTANGTMGGSNPACAADLSSTFATYTPFMSNAPQYNKGWWANSSSFPHWLTYYSPVAVRPTQFIVTNRNYTGDNNHIAITTGYIYGSNDNTNWTELTSFTNYNTDNNQTWLVSVQTSNYYKYMRITATNSSTPANGAWISKLVIRGYTK